MYIYMYVPYIYIYGIYNVLTLALLCELGLTRVPISNWWVGGKEEQDIHNLDESDSNRTLLASLDWKPGYPGFYS